MQKEVILYGPKFTNRAHQLKVQGAATVRPEILAIGSSRMNQWRSAMFHPYRFFNGANTINMQRDYRRFIEDIGYPKPKVVIFSLDYFTLDDKWDAQYRGQTYDDDMRFASGLFLKALRGVMDDALDSPRSIIVGQEPIYSTPALGLYATRMGNGFRGDGSYQYGSFISKYKGGSVWYPDDCNCQDRIKFGRGPFVFGDELSKDRLRELEDFAAYAKTEGIILIGVTSPFHPSVVETLERSTRHSSWRIFNSRTMSDWFKSRGIIYFNFSRIEAFGGRPDEFVDYFHPSEPAYIRMFLAMLKDPKVRNIFSDISISSLESRLLISTSLEAYRNDF